MKKPRFDVCTTQNILTPRKRGQGQQQCPTLREWWLLLPWPLLDCLSAGSSQGHRVSAPGGTECQQGAAGGTESQHRGALCVSREQPGAPSLSTRGHWVSAGSSRGHWVSAPGGHWVSAGSNRGHWVSAGSSHGHWVSAPGVCRERGGLFRDSATCTWRRSHTALSTHFLPPRSCLEAAHSHQPWPSTRTKWDPSASPVVFKAEVA